MSKLTSLRGNTSSLAQVLIKGSATECDGENSYRVLGKDVQNLGQARRESLPGGITAGAHTPHQTFHCVRRVSARVRVRHVSDDHCGSTSPGMARHDIKKGEKEKKARFIVHKTLSPSVQSSIQGCASFDFSVVSLNTQTWIIGDGGKQVSDCCSDEIAS